MPLPKRAIGPVLVSNVVVPKEVDNELEYVANATLSNLTRQLASLSLQAADLFTELTEQLTAITNRNERLNHRIETLRVVLSETAIREDDLGLVTLQINPYKSRMEADQQVLNKTTLPNSISEIYMQCEPPPALEQLDRFRYDNKQSMKFYTDPTFFFHLWCQEMLQDTKQKKKKKKRRLKKQPPGAKRSDSQICKTNTESNKIIQNGSCVVVDSSLSNRAKNVNLNGFELPPPLLPPMESHNISLPQPQFNYEDVSIYNTIVPPKDTSPMPNKGNQVINNETQDLDNISPPPPAMSYLSHKPGAHPTSSNVQSNINQHNDYNNDQSFRNQSTVGQESTKVQEFATDNNRDTRITSIPPPPAPPPPPSVPPPPTLATQLNIVNHPKQNIYAVNAQSIDLLTAIRNGIHLRKVGDDDNRPVPITEAVSKAEKKFDVQAIFEEVYKRRPYVDNNSDSDDGTDEDEDSSLWSSDNDK